MKVRYLLLASLALPAAPALAQDASAGSATAAVPANGNEIVVTGRGLDETPATPAYDTQVLSRDEIISTSSGRLEDALSGVAGFQQFRRSDSRSTNTTTRAISRTSRAPRSLLSSTATACRCSCIKYWGFHERKSGAASLRRAGFRHSSGDGKSRGLRGLCAELPLRPAPCGGIAGCAECCESARRSSAQDRRHRSASSPARRGRRCR